MDERGADRRAEMPEDSRKVAGGTREKKGRERQASTVEKEETQAGAKVLMEEVLRRENMLRALRRVRSNKGGTGSRRDERGRTGAVSQGELATHPRGVA